MGVDELLITVMRDKGKPMTAQEIHEAIMTYCKAHDLPNTYDSAFIAKRIRQHCLGLEVPHADAEKWFKVIHGNRYCLLEKPVTKKLSGSSTRKDQSGNSGPVFGSPINFRGLRYAPLNEQGVIYIFGMVSHELGFIVEALQSAFPDCEAKRSIGPDRWQRVRIEFEFHSSNYCLHGHPLDGSDLIVCWEHDWPDCPIEVLELRSAIDFLKKEGKGDV